MTTVLDKLSGLWEVVGKYPVGTVTNPKGALEYKLHYHKFHTLIEQTWPDIEEALRYVEILRDVGDAEAEKILAPLLEEVDG